MGLFGKLFDFNRDGETSPVEGALGFSLLAAAAQADAEEAAAGAEEEEAEALAEAEEEELLDATGYDRFDLELMDPDERERILWDNGLDPEDYDFDP